MGNFTSTRRSKIALRCQLCLRWGAHIVRGRRRIMRVETIETRRFFRSLDYCMADIHIILHTPHLSLLEKGTTPWHLGDILYNWVCPKNASNCNCSWLMLLSLGKLFLQTMGGKGAFQLVSGSSFLVGLMIHMIYLGFPTRYHQPQLTQTLA